MILHVDMDAFYASVEQRDRPELRGKPVIVGGSAEGRGVVCAASYEARKFGVRSAMPAITARKLCPHGVFLPVRMARYAEVSRQIREIFLAYTPLVEPLSLDEAFLDVHGCEPLFGPAPEIAHQLKARILADTHLVASVGVAPNKFLAKLASDLGKPNGFVIVESDRVREFLEPLPVNRIWGVGAKGEKRLHTLGLRTIGDLAAVPEHFLVDHLGEAGRYMWELAQGRDERAVIPDRQAKTVSAETTFATDIGDREVLRYWLLELVEQLGQRLRQQGLLARTIDIKVRSSEFRTCTRSHSLAEATDLTETIWKVAANLLDQRVPSSFLPLRLIGVGASGLVREAGIQGNLFEDGHRARQKALDRTIDALRAQFGPGAIRRGGTLE
jgi:DNA polymerase-4